MKTNQVNRRNVRKAPDFPMSGSNNAPVQFTEQPRARKPEPELPYKPVKKKNRVNIYECLSALIATVLLFALAVLSFTSKDREYSENENRYLAQKPLLSLSSIEDGKFMKDTDTYLSDQFVFRDQLVSTRTGIDVFFGKREINGVYVGRKHFLFEKPSEYDEKRVSKTIGTMNAISANNPNVRSYVAIAPNSSEVLKKLMPLNAPTQDQTEQIKNVYSNLTGYTGIDLCGPLKEAEEPETLYYKTDHHWTAAAVDIAFPVIAGSMQLNTSGYTYENIPVTNSFKGTLASSSGIFSASDTISVPAYKPDIMYRVTYVNEGKTCNTVFDESKLDEKSKYEVFFGGNFAQINIEANPLSDRVLVIVKDSYANSLIPLLIPHFKKIIIVDPRYYNDNLQTTIDQEEVTDILWLYNANTFLNDTSITGKLSY